MKTLLFFLMFLIPFPCLGQDNLEPFDLRDTFNPFNPSNPDNIRQRTDEFNKQKNTVHFANGSSLEVYNDRRTMFLSVPEERDNPRSLKIDRWNQFKAIPSESMFFTDRGIYLIDLEDPELLRQVYDFPDFPSHKFFFEINDASDWVVCTSGRCVVGQGRDENPKTVYRGFSTARYAHISIADSGHWTLLVDKLLIVGFRSEQHERRVHYAKTLTGGSAIIDDVGNWVSAAGRSVFSGSYKGRSSEQFKTEYVIVDAKIKLEVNGLWEIEGHTSQLWGAFKKAGQF